jgi:peptide/nickel transport system permease protein
MTQIGGEPGQALDHAGAPTGGVTDGQLTGHEAAALELAPDGVLDASLADVGPSRSLAGDAWRRFKRTKLAMAGLVIVGFLVLVAVLGPILAQSPTDQSPFNNEKPTNQHWFGTDRLGHDVFAQIVHGIRLSLFIAFLATVIETIIGITIGAVAGWFGGIVDAVLMRFVDIVLGIPYLVLALVLISVLGKGVTAVIITLALIAWLQTARTVRAGFLQVRDLEYIEAARAVGVPSRRIVWRHILPNVFQPVVVLVAVGIGTAILAEAALSFLGVGVQPPDPSLGRMIAESSRSFTRAPHLLLFPGGAIILTVLGFLLVGDGLRDALDVKDT